MSVVYFLRLTIIKQNNMHLLRFVSVLSMTVLLITPVLLRAQPSNIISKEENEYNQVKTCKTQVVSQLNNAKKRAQVLKLLPKAFRESLLAMHERLVSKLTPKQRKNKKTMNSIIKKLQKECEKLKKTRAKSQDTTNNSQDQKNDGIPSLLNAVANENVAVGATDSLYTHDEDVAKKEHGFNIGFAGGPAWQRLVELNFQQALSIQVTMSCGFFRQGTKDIGNTIRLSQALLTWFYLYNEAKGFMGCPTAGAVIKFYNKAGEVLKVINTPPIDWSKTQYK